MWEPEHLRWSTDGRVPESQDRQADKGAQPVAGAYDTFDAFAGCAAVGHVEIESGQMLQITMVPLQGSDRQ